MLEANAVDLRVITRFAGGLAEIDGVGVLPLKLSRVLFAGGGDADVS